MWQSAVLLLLLLIEGANFGAASRFQDHGIDCEVVKDTFAFQCLPRVDSLTCNLEQMRCHISHYVIEHKTRLRRSGSATLCRYNTNTNLPLHVSIRQSCLLELQYATTES